MLRFWQLEASPATFAVRCEPCELELHAPVTFDAHETGRTVVGTIRVVALTLTKHALMRGCSHVPEGGLLVQDATPRRRRRR